ncbi:unnamed protein product [Pedinophyceae sp. YPF-701]|nr:unnamed protein product [Pedinophyceae sp. YPF-701]
MMHLSTAARQAVCPRSESRRTATRTHAATGRRALLGIATLLPAAPALALIPDDDDEELVAKAKANRKARLAEQRVTEREFAVAEGQKNLKLESKLPPVQTAVNSLIKTADALSKDQVDASFLAPAVVSGLSDAAAQISTTPSAKDAVGPMMASIGDLTSALAKGSAGDAKAAMVSTVGALKTWAKEAGAEKYIKGL